MATKKKAAKKKTTTSAPKKTAGTKFNTVAAYLDSLPTHVRKAVVQLQRTIHQAIPGGEDVISYNIPAYKSDGRVIIFYSGWSEHVSLYPRSAALDASIKDVAQYAEGKGTLKFPLDKPLPLALIKKIAVFRRNEMRKKLSVSKNKK